MENFIFLCIVMYMQSDMIHNLISVSLMDMNIYNKITIQKINSLRFFHDKYPTFSSTVMNWITLSQKEVKALHQMCFLAHSRIFEPVKV